MAGVTVISSSQIGKLCRKRRGQRNDFTSGKKAECFIVPFRLMKPETPGTSIELAQNQPVPAVFSALSLPLGAANGKLLIIINPNLLRNSLQVLTFPLPKLLLYRLAGGGQRREPDALLLDGERDRADRGRSGSGRRVFRAGKAAGQIQPLCAH